MIFLISLRLNAQKETNVWLFGEFAGLDFNHETPVGLNTGKLKTWEGVASICDSLGNLLLYTNGENVWNKFDRIIPNGSGLLGSYTSTQSAIVIPKPLNKDLYYIFTVDSQAQPLGFGLNYSLVDVSANNREGAVIEKNIFLKNPVPEKLTAIKHANLKDFWVVAHEWDTNNFLSYLVTENGVSKPIESAVGLKHSELGNIKYNLGSLGYMKFSTDGSLLAVAHSEKAIVELFHFNSETGQITPFLSLLTGTWPYGLEFSPNNRFLYISEESSINQLDLWSGSIAQIKSSYQLISNKMILANNDKDFHFEYGALQLASDGRIYVAIRGLPLYEQSKYISVISNPNNKSTLCNYSDSAIYLNGRNCTLGLPNFIQSFLMPLGFRWFGTCLNGETKFLVDNDLLIDDVLWDFGDYESPHNFSALKNPSHTYTKKGTFPVKLKYTFNSKIDSIIKFISISEVTNFSFDYEKRKCQFDTIVLKINSPNSLFRWQDNSTDSIFLVKKEGVYQLELKNPYGCLSNSLITIIDIPNPKFDLGDDLETCEGVNLIIDTKLKEGHFLWNDKISTKSFFEPKLSGIYKVKVTNAEGCSSVDSIKVNFKPIPKFNLGPDTLLCQTQKIKLKVPTFEGASIIWNSGNQLDHLDIIKEGIYWCKITSVNSCSYSDSIVVKSLFKPKINFPKDTFICEKSLVLDVYQKDSKYKWENGSEDSKITIKENSKIWLEIENRCGISRSSMNVNFIFCNKIVIPNIITPNNDGVNDFFQISGVEGEDWLLFIYNRWGSLIYESQNYHNNWPTQNISDGTYYYILQNKFKLVDKHGYLDVIH